MGKWTIHWFKRGWQSPICFKWFKTLKINCRSEITTRRTLSFYDIFLFILAFIFVPPSLSIYRSRHSAFLPAMVQCLLICRLRMCSLCDSVTNDITVTHKTPQGTQYRVWLTATLPTRHTRHGQTTQTQDRLLSVCLPDEQTLRLLLLQIYRWQRTPKA